MTVAIGHLANVASVTRWRGAFAPRRASAAIHHRFVYEVGGVHVPSRFPTMVLSSRRLPFLLRGPGEPSSPALCGTMKALRLPIRASAVAYGFAPAAHAFLLLRVRLCAPARAEVTSGPGFWWCRLPQSPALTRGRAWDLSGLQAIHPVPLLRSSTPVEPACPCHCGHVDAAPALRTAKASGDG